MPDIPQKYGKKAPISVVFNPTVVPENHMKFARANNRIVFKKDQAEVTLGSYFDLTVKDKQEKWIVLR